MPKINRLSIGIVVAIALTGALIYIVFTSNRGGIDPQSQLGAVSSILRPSNNPHYCMDASGKAVYWGGLGFHDMYQTVVPYGQAIKYPDIYNDMQALGLNIVRGRIQHDAYVWCEGCNQFLYRNPTIYKQSPTGGLANDGRTNKFDLTQFNDAFFTGMRQRVIEGRDKGIYTYISLYMIEAAGWWQGHPWNAANNVNGVNGDANGDGRGFEIYLAPASFKGNDPATWSSWPLWSHHTAYLDKIVATLGDIDHAIFAPGNEMLINAKEWQYAVINSLISKGIPRERLGMSAQGDWWIGGYGGPLTDLQNNPGGWFPPGWLNPNNAYDHDPPVDTSRVVIVDTDHTHGWAIPPSGWAWKIFTRGGHPLLMDAYIEESGRTTPSEKAQVVETRKQIGQSVRYADRMGLINMRPRNDLTSTAYALANPGTEYLVYQPAGGSFTLNLAAGTYAAEWFNVSSGQTTLAAAVTGTGASQTFTPPFGGLAVLYLKLAGSGTSSGTTPSTISVTSPSGGNSIVVGTSVTVDANFFDTVNILGIQFKLDGQKNIGAEDTSAPYSVVWDTAGETIGTHTLSAVARDITGSVGTAASVSVTITGAPIAASDTISPAVSITSPASGATVSGVTGFAVSASDNVGVTKVEFYIDGQLKGSDTTAPYSYAWDTTNGGAHACLGAHTHNLTSKAYDAAGNVTTSPGIVMNMNNPSYCNTPVTPSVSPVLHHTFDAADINWSNFTATDKSEYNNNGTLNNMTQGANTVTGRIGQALDFDGINEYVNLGNPSALQITTAAMSMSAWVKIDAWSTAGKYAAIISKTAATPPYGGYQLNLNNDAGQRFNCAIANSSAWNIVAGNAGKVTGTWYHVTCVYNGTDMRLYVNGVQEGTPTVATGNIRNVAANVSLGRNEAFSTDAYVNGIIDDVRIYNRALSVSEIQGLVGTAPQLPASTYAVTLSSSGTGQGTVAGGGNYAAGATVTLSATPASGSTFGSWLPAPCAASFSMPTQGLTCTATFNSLQTPATGSLRQITTTGSIAAGSNQLTVPGASGFQVGDWVIVEIGKEQGQGLRGTRGVGGTGPSTSYQTQA